MDKLHRRGERGASILASLVVVAALGGAALLADLQGLNPVSQIGGALLAQNTTNNMAGAPPTVTQTNTIDAKKIDLKKKCDEAISRAKTSGTNPPTSGEKPRVEDDCVAVVKKGTAYTCAGKSVVVTIRRDGSVLSRWTANPGVEVGTCATLACRPVSFPLDVTTAKCFTAKGDQITKQTLETGIDGPNSFYRDRTGGFLLGGESNLLQPLTHGSVPLDQQSILKQALGADPNLDTRYVPIALDANGDLKTSPYDQILKFTDPNSPEQKFNEDVMKLSDSTINNPVKLNPTGCYLEDCPGATTNFCDGNGCYAQPADVPAREALLAQNKGWVCDVKSTGEPGFSCFNPDTNALKTPTGPSQDPPKGPSGPTGPSGPGGNDSTGNNNQQNTGNSGGQNPFGQLMQMLGKLLGGGGQQQAPTCPTDPNAYQQQQQQYNQQLQQYNMQLQQYNYQQQFQGAQGFGSAPPPVAPVPCKPAPPPPRPTPPPAAPKAEISCQPKVGDIGMLISISYSCSSGKSEGSGFETGGAKSGSATSTLATPQGNANTATYTLTCEDKGRTSKAECSVQVARPGIVLVANPEAVKRNGISRIGWITAGMKSCVISSPDHNEFTADNAGNTSINGTVNTPPLRRSADFVLKCETLGGSTRQQKITVNVI